MEVLRFTDSGVVQRVHDYMIKLLKADAVTKGAVKRMRVCWCRTEKVLFRRHPA